MIVTKVRKFPWEGLARAVMVGPGKAAECAIVTSERTYTFVAPHVAPGETYTLPIMARRIERRPGRRRVWVVE